MIIPATAATPIFITMFIMRIKTNRIDKQIINDNNNNDRVACKGLAALVKMTVTVNGERLNDLQTA